MEKVCLRLAYFNPVLPLYRNHPIDLLHKSVDWFLYNGNASVNGKVDALLKVVSATFLLVCFFASKIEYLWNKQKCFLLHFESSFWDNQILTFQIFKCHDVIKCLSMKHETYIIE